MEEVSLEQALTLCGLRAGEAFSVAAIREREIRPGCFTDISQAESFLAQYAGWNHYLCGNPVRPETQGKPKAEDVLSGRVMLIDADPTSPTANTAEAIQKVLVWCMKFGACPAIIDSGRGTQAWLRTKLTPEQRRALIQHLARKCATPDVKFDATHNPDRLMRLPGSTNLKTGRLARIVSPGNGVYFTSQHFEEAKVPPAVDATSKSSAYDGGMPTPIDMAFVSGPVKMIWDGAAEKGERSKRDFLLVLELLRAGATEDTACRLLFAMPGGKATEDKRGREYWDPTLASVRRHQADEERKRARAFALPDASKKDAGAPFEEESLDALLFVRSGPEADWQRLRSSLKGSKVAIRALEQAMDARVAAQIGGEPAQLRFVADDTKRVGWFKKTREDGWVSVDGTEARATMRAQGQDQDVEVKALTDAPWHLVNEPFQPEELSDRRWNKDAARFAVIPEPGGYPTWRMMLEHVGHNIDSVVQADEWCKLALVTTGSQYLMKWIAAMFQRPKARTAYLFLHGPQEAGKSTIHEALKDLLSKGYVKANHAIKSKEGFNGEIANAVLCAIEEIDLSDPRRDTFERVKDWVTGETITVRALYRQALDFVNTTHWIQAAQKRAFMPVLPGDTRITEIYVEVAESPIPKDQFRDNLRKEGPQFLYAALHEPLPPQTGRLFIPALNTRGKSEQQDAARTELEDWMENHPWIELSEDQMVGAFLEWLPMNSKSHWDRARVLREIPEGARPLRRLAVALREALRGGGLPVSSIYGALPPGARADWTGPIPLGKRIRKIKDRLPWLEMVTVKGLDIWRLKESI